MYVLATAGHVDHGKSTLVRALTGMEPDRWQEEKRRGLTIDLGYAWTTLPEGEELAFVDVPGHERFIANMLAGLGPAPGVLFVVAADSGWAAQSREHLAAVDALGLRHGLLAITRSDLADPAPALAEARAELARSSLGEVPAVAVSGTTGAGLDELRDRLADLCAAMPAPAVDARVRLWVDRVFTVRGSGTVVTGTLEAGTVGVGDTLQLDDREVVVRSIQSLGRDRAQVAAVARVALNLRGLSHGDVARGDVLLGPGEWHRTRVLDVRMRAVGDAERLPARQVLHVGTLAAPVHVRPLGPDTARLTLARDLPLLAGDRAVLRDPGRHAVVAGVEVLDADPPQLRRRGAARDRGHALADGRPDAYQEIARRGAVQREHLDALGIAVPERHDLHQHAGWIVTDGVWRDWQAAASDAVVQWAAQHPLDPAMPRAALIQRLGLPDDRMLDPVLAAAGLAGGGGRVAAPWAVTLGPAEDAVRTVESRLSENPFQAPDRDELRALQLGRRELAAAEKAQRLLRIDDDLVLLPGAPALALKRLRTLPQPFTASQARAVLDTTRRVAIPLLEYLDRAGLTERVDGTSRSVVQSPPGEPANDSTAPRAERIAE
ncbi:MAG TPA: selenocysteine-specific translation elongation factor [Jatrophihabitans sp.]|jgi:selenocysteine-specific elongation factor